MLRGVSPAMHRCPVPMPHGRPCGQAIMTTRVMCNRHWVLVPKDVRGRLADAAGAGDWLAFERLVDEAVGVVAKREESGQ